MTDTLEFSYRAARSGAITAAIIAVIVIESAAVHFAVVVRWESELGVHPRRPSSTTWWTRSRRRFRE